MCLQLHVCIFVSMLAYLFTARWVVQLKTLCRSLHNASSIIFFCCFTSKPATTTTKMRKLKWNKYLHNFLSFFFFIMPSLNISFIRFSFHLCEFHSNMRKHTSTYTEVHSICMRTTFNNRHCCRIDKINVMQ